MDLDRTLFDTDRFIEGVWSYAGELYGLDIEAERLRAKQFYDMYGNSYDYRFFDHLRDCVGADFDQEDFVRGAKRALSGQFLYADVTPQVIDIIHAILTFGNTQYQMFKLSLCPELEGIDYHIVLEPKGAYISRTFPVPTLLVDDKDLKGECVPPAYALRIDRSLEEREAKEAGVIRTLASVPAALSRIARESTNDTPYGNVKS